MRIQKLIYITLYSAALISALSACSFSSSQSKKDEPISETATQQQNLPKPSENVNAELLQEEKSVRSITIQEADGTSCLICEDGLSAPMESFDKSKIAYLSADESGRRPELNIYEVEMRKNNAIDIQPFVEHPLIKSIGWYNNETLLFSTSEENTSLGSELYALYTEDMHIKNLAVCTDIQIESLENGLTLRYGADTNNAFTYRTSLYEWLMDRENQKVYEIKFNPTPTDFKNPNKLNTDGLYERATKPYFLYPQKEGELFRITPYAIGTFLTYDPNSETSLMPDEKGAFWGFDTDWYPCGLWCGLEAEIVASATSTLAPQGNYSYEVDSIVRPSQPDRNHCWSEGVAGDGIGERITLRLKMLGGGPYSYTKYKAHEVDDRGFPIMDDEIYEGEDCVFFYTNLCIVNGYAKNETFWRENSRVKFMKLYVNDVLYGNIALEDTIEPQYLPLYNIPANAEKETTFAFEITDVYKGEKYEDTCLTGINFNVRGIGGHGHED